MPPGKSAVGLGCAWERNRPSVSEEGCSAKATEAEAGQRPVPPKVNAGPAAFIASLGRAPAMGWLLCQTHPWQRGGSETGGSTSSSVRLACSQIQHYSA